MSKGQAQQFFKQDVFRLLAKELWRRYYFKGEFGSSAGLGLFKEVDTEPLRGLLGLTSLAWSKKKSLSLSTFATAMADSAVAWTLVEFVETVWQALVLKTDVVAQENAAFQQFKAELEQIAPVYLKLLTDKQVREWFQSETVSLADFRLVAKALKHLPTDYLRIPVFAYEQSGDAHAFDSGMPAERLLLQILAAQSQKEERVGVLAEVEAKNDLLNEFYLLRDDILNFAAIRGLVATSDGEINEMWRQASLQGCSWNVPLKEISRMDEIRPMSGEKVLIVENSGIYSILIDLFPNVPIICSSGQFVYAIWQLLRKLVASGTHLYYCGDCDPEGLLMAQRVFDTFPAMAHTVGMSLENYQYAARPSEISSQRLKQLRHIRQPELKLVADKIATSGIALQEGMLDQLIAEVRQVFQE